MIVSLAAVLWSGDESTAHMEAHRRQRLSGKDQGREDYPKQHDAENR